MLILCVCSLVRLLDSNRNRIRTDVIGNSGVFPSGGEGFGLDDASYHLVSYGRLVMDT